MQEGITDISIKTPSPKWLSALNYLTGVYPEDSDLAELLGVNAITIKRWRHTMNKPTKELRAKIIEYAKIEMEDILNK